MVINPQAPHPMRNAAQMFREIYTQDCYKMRSVQFNPATIIDIGANIGMFSVYTRALFPSAYIMAIEPCLATYEVLQQNIAWLNICHRRAALGNGERFREHIHQDGDGSNQCRVDGTGEEVASFTLRDFINTHGLEPFILKMDCEGGEASLLKSAEDSALLAKAGHWAMEYHAKIIGVSAFDAFQVFSKADPRTVSDGRLHEDVCMFWSHNKEGVPA
jgi:FkbM family methyltransferase